MFHTKFQLNPINSSGEEVEIDFQDGHRSGHIGYQIDTICTNFNLLVAPMLHTKFQLNPISGSGEEVENRFSRRPPWWPCWISNRHHLFILKSTSCPDAPNQISGQSDKWFGKGNKKLIFKMAAMAAILDIESAPFIYFKIY